MVAILTSLRIRYKVSGGLGKRIVGGYFEGLLTRIVVRKPIPGQAESWTISETV